MIDKICLSLGSLLVGWYCGKSLEKRKRESDVYLTPNEAIRLLNRVVCLTIKKKMDFYVWDRERKKIEQEVKEETDRTSTLISQLIDKFKNKR